MAEIKPHQIGQRAVVLLNGPCRGKCGWIRGVKSVEDGGNRAETPCYLVTDIMGDGVGDWWIEVLHHDLTVIREAQR